MDSRSYIRASSLSGLAQLSGAKPDDFHAALDRAGIPRSAANDPHQLIAFRSLASLLEIGAREWEMPSLGIRFTMAQPSHYPHLGPLLKLAHFNPNAREWLNDSIRYLSFHSNAFTIVLIEDYRDGLACLRYVYDGLAAPTRQLSEHIIANIVGIVRLGTGRIDENPSLIRLRHNKPANMMVHDEFFGCPCEFGAVHNEILFRPEILDYKTGGDLTVLRPLVRRYIQFQIDHMPFYDGLVGSNVALAISSMLGIRKVDITLIAEMLETHPKKLQRDLADEGTSFSEILEQTRKNIAIDLMRNSRAPVAHVAGLLDYASTPPFSLAFKRWTGMSPLQLRNDQQFDEQTHLSSQFAPDTNA